MSKLGKSILRGATEALSYAKGHKKHAKAHRIKIPKKVNVSAIRGKLHMSQSTFASSFGFSPRTIEKWEQGIRQPAGAARAYLIVIAHNPEAVQLALSSMMRSHSRNKGIYHKGKE